MFNLIKSLCVLSLMFTSMIVSANDHIENKIREDVRSWVDVDITNKKSKIQKMVFSCDFYSTSPKFKSPNITSSLGVHLYYESGDELKHISKPNQSRGMPGLHSCINPNITINNEDSAQLLMEAIEDLFATKSYFSNSNQNHVRKTAKGWELITGKFFEDFSGYFVEIDKAGKITGIRYSLSL